MDKSREQIPQWAWYNVSFMLQFDQARRRNPNQSISDFFTAFLENEGIKQIGFYHTANQGTVIMAMYGLLVAPKEIWEKRSTNFAFQTRQHFSFTLGDSNMPTADFLWFLRNAVSHANFSIDTGMSVYTFWNINRQKVKDFEVRIQHEDLGDFLTEVGKYYINEVKNK